MTIEEIQERVLAALGNEINAATALRVSTDAIEHIQGIFADIQQRSAAGDQPSYDELQLAMSEAATRAGAIVVWMALFAELSGIDLGLAVQTFLTSCEGTAPLEN